MHPAELRNMVTSPGGTSAAALHELESGRLRTVLSEAVWAAYRRTVELGDQLEARLDVADGKRPPRPVMPSSRTAGTGAASGGDLGRSALADVASARPALARSATSGPTRPRSGTG